MTTRTRPGEVVTRLADSFMAAVYDCQQNGGGRPHWSRFSGIQHPAAAAYDVEVQALMKRSRSLRVALGRVCAQGAAPEPATRAHFVELLEHELERTPAHALRSFEALLGMLDLLEANGLPRAAVESPYRVILADPRLAVVVNWQESDAEARIPVRLGPLPSLSD